MKDLRTGFLDRNRVRGNSRAIRRHFRSSPFCAQGARAPSAVHCLQQCMVVEANFLEGLVGQVFEFGRTFAALAALKATSPAAAVCAPCPTCPACTNNCSCGSDSGVGFAVVVGGLVGFLIGLVVGQFRCCWRRSRSRAASSSSSDGAGDVGVQQARARARALHG